jgi:hypothetical protein
MVDLMPKIVHYFFYSFSVIMKKFTSLSGERSLFLPDSSLLLFSEV